MGEPSSKILFRAARFPARHGSSRYMLALVLLMWVLAANPVAHAQSKGSGEGMQLAGGGANPTLRFPVAHSHTLTVCVGYLYVSADKVRYEAVGPDNANPDSFDLRRDQIQDVHPKMGGVQFHSTVNNRNYLFAVTKVSVVENKSNHLSVWNVRDPRELLKSLEHFDEMLALARVRAGQSGTTVGAVGELAAHSGPKPEDKASVSDTSTVDIPAADTPERGARLLQRRLDVMGHGIYELDSEIVFNVLDSVYYDPASGQISLVGHRDERYHGPRIPYLQHLAALLETDRPEFTLTVTRDSEKRIDALFNTALSSSGSEKIYSMLRNIIDANGMVTETGRLLLPSLGVYPIQGNRKPGYFGAQVALTPDGMLRVTQVSSGSPAEAAGIKTGDQLTDYSIPDPLLFQRRAWFAGAGAVIDLNCLCNQQWKPLHVTLSEDPDHDVWKYVTRYDVISLMYRAANNADAAKVIDAMGVYEEVQRNQPTLQQPAFFNLIIAMGIFSEMEELKQEIASGKTSVQDGQRRVGDRIAQRFEQIFQFPSSSLVQVFESTLLRGDFNAAIAAIFTQFDVQFKPKFGEILDRVMFGPEGFQIPAELVEQQFQIHPEMHPEYLGVAPNSLLARAMFDADYLCKRLMNRPDLKRTVREYRTAFEFEVEHPEFKRQEASYRLWISVDKMGVAQSADERTLEFRNVKMRFNVRELGAGGRDLPNRPGGYEELLTSLYEPLSQEYATLHELSEAAKVAAVARWIHIHNPSARLPQEGRVAWRGPSRLPGLVFLYVFPDTQKNMHLHMIATGGISLTPFPPENVQNPFLNDSSVVNLSDIPETRPLVVFPPIEYNSELSRVLHHQVTVPDLPHPAGWVAVANKGTRLLHSVSVVLNNPGERDPERQREMRSKLDSCHQVGLRLAQTERAFNILNSENASRARELQQLQDELRHDRDEFTRLTLEGLRQAGDDMRTALRDKSDNEDVRSVLGTFSLINDIKEDSEKSTPGMVLAALYDATKNWATEPKPGSLSAVDLRAPFRELFEKFGEAKLMVLTLEQEALLAKLEFVTDYKVDRLGAGQAKDADALSKLEEMRKQLSDQADQCLRDPELRASFAASGTVVDKEPCTLEATKPFVVDSAAARAKCDSTKLVRAKCFERTPRPIPYHPKWISAELRQYLEANRGEIPLWLLVGWISVESDGNFQSPPTAPEYKEERGYFQINTDESQYEESKAAHCENHEQLSTDRYYSLRCGIAVARHDEAFIRRLGFDEGDSDLFWRMVKFSHAIGPDAVETIIKDMKHDQVSANSWEAISTYSYNNCSRLSGEFKRNRRDPHPHDPVKWVGNVDAVFKEGHALLQ